MRAFRCGNCTQLVFFENSLCLNCETPLGFSPSDLEIKALKGEDEDAVRCANASLAECNWLVEDEGETHCRSCRLTAVRPADDDTDGLANFASAEGAKRRIIFQLLDLGLPVEEGKLSFQLESSSFQPVTTGHADGVVTVDLAESDDAQRTSRREELGEPYRTMLGHFRHELGHYYQDILLGSEEEKDRSRKLFGDEREDYQAAMDQHYENGPPADWPERFVSSYATMHPWEDWAETFAHYLHIRDTLETAADFGVKVEGPKAVEDVDGADFEAAPEPEDAERGFDVLLGDWLPLSYALNQINRSMGHEDLYPFTLPQPVVDKLTYMHDRFATFR